MEKVERFGENHPLLKDAEGIANFWKKYTLYNFNDINTLKKIIPKNNEEFATHLVETLIDFAEEIKGDIPKLNKLKKK